MRALYTVSTLLEQLKLLHLLTSFEDPAEQVSRWTLKERERVCARYRGGRKTQAEKWKTDNNCREPDLP